MVYITVYTQGGTGWCIPGYMPPWVGIHPGICLPVIPVIPVIPGMSLIPVIPVIPVIPGFRAQNDFSSVT